MAISYYEYGSNLLHREKYTSVVKIGDKSKRYFSSIDTDVYFGNTYIDEMVAFDFTIEEKKLPLYGYNTFTPKRIITGQKMIQGSFAINFTETFNLKYILDEVDESLYANPYEVVTSFCADDNRAIFNKSFDITLSYGDAKDTEGYKSFNACTQTLVGCYITSYRQAFDTSGEPILDMYTFIAKDLMVGDNLQEESNEPKVGPYSSTYNNKDGGEYIIPPGGGGGGGPYPPKQQSVEPYLLGDQNLQADVNEIMNYCSANETTLGVLVSPTVDYIDGQVQVSLRISECNNKDLFIEKIIIDITDVAVTGSMKTIELNKARSTSQHYEIMSHNRLELGKELKRLLEGSESDGLECIVTVIASDGTQSYNMQKKPKPYMTLRPGTGLK